MPDVNLGHRPDLVNAVVAIAITLLVLPLVDLVSELEINDSVLDLLNSHQAELGAFLLSFAVISSLWFAQHSVMAAVDVQDTTVARLLMLWTLTIVFLPFPTALVSQEGHEAATKVLYIGTMALSSACLGLIATWISRHPSLYTGDRRPDPAFAWGSTLTLLLALCLSLAVPALGYWALLILLGTAPVVRLLRRVAPSRR